MSFTILIMLTDYTTISQGINIVMITILYVLVHWDSFGKYHLLDLLQRMAEVILFTNTHLLQISHLGN